MTLTRPSWLAKSRPATRLLALHHAGQPGQETAAQLLGSIKKGIYLKSLLGFGQSNIINGDFSANLALGYLIENGEIVGRLKNVMLAGNILDLLKGEVRFSSDCDPQDQQPAAVLEGISAVSAKA